MRREAIFGAALVVAIGLVSGAGCTPGSDCDFGLCTPYIPADGGLPSNCDLSLSPSSEPTCVVDAVGVFVSPNGHAGAAATMADPVASVGEGVQRAVTLKLPRVYVCAGNYTEPLTMTSAISIYGGFDCSSWLYTKTVSIITSPKGPALSVHSVTDLITIADLGFSAFSNGNTKGDSAVAVLLLESNVTFERVAITAGAGQPGDKGATTKNAKPGDTGNAAMGNSGATARTCTCVDDSTSTGGRGADAALGNADNGSSNPPTAAHSNEGTSGMASCTLGTAGLDGMPGDATSSTFTTPPGIVTASGWDNSNTGTAGENGLPGQGGGGTGSEQTFAGGGGGCGGCGGGTGLNGKNGGASLGIVAYSSLVVVTDSTITTGAGGLGGQGGDGEAGGLGGAGGQGGSNCGGAPGYGGAGGNGAGGNGGNGGAGGDSIAVAYGGTGAALTVRGGVLKPGSFGMGGPGGAAGAMASATLGLSGAGGGMGIMGRSLPRFPQ